MLQKVVQSGERKLCYKFYVPPVTWKLTKPAWLNSEKFLSTTTTFQLIFQDFDGTVELLSPTLYEGILWLKQKLSNFVLISLLGVVHKWRHTTLDIYWQPLSSRFLLLSPENYILSLNPWPSPPLMPWRHILTTPYQFFVMIWFVIVNDENIVSIFIVVSCFQFFFGEIEISEEPMWIQNLLNFTTTQNDCRCYDGDEKGNS